MVHIRIRFGSGTPLLPADESFISENEDIIFISSFLIKADLLVEVVTNLELVIHSGSGLFFLILMSSRKKRDTP